MKKILFLFFATILVNQVWAYDFKSGKLCYNITSNNTVEVTEGNYSNLSTIIIPNEVIFKNITYSVTSIGIAAFSDCSGLTSVTIPNSVTNIESGAFYDCNELSSISIGSSVAYIGEDAFFGCNNLKFNTDDNAYYLGSVENPYVVLFEAKNKNIMSCVINNKCRIINDMAFYDCQLAQISIPNSVVSIGRNAFGYCKLTSVTIPNSVTSIGELAFSDCKKLKSVVIPNSVTSIVSSVFFGCSNLTSVTIPSSVTSIGEKAFFGCRSLDSITIPDSVKTIGDYAFANCFLLVSAIIPNSITSIGNDAFSGCGGFTSITTDCEIIGGANLYLTKDGIRYKVLNKNSIEVASNSYSGEIVIPASITAGNTFIVASIGDYAFRSCDNLTSINIPNSVTNIGVSAFTGCKGLTSITIPNSVTNIGEGAFDGCLNLKNVYFQAGTKPIGWNAKWENKDKPATSNQNKTATANKEKASSAKDFYGEEPVRYYDFSAVCSSGQTLYYKYMRNPSTVRICRPMWYPNLVAELKTYGDCERPKGNLIIPETVTYEGKTYIVTEISDGVFNDCNELTSVTIPNCIGKIGENAFIASEKLTSVIIKSEARCDNAGLYLQKGGIRYQVLNKNEVMVDTKEYESPFFNSNPQKYSGDIVIPSKVIAGNTFSVVAINDAAFAESIDLKTVTIPNAVKTIGRDAFRNCIHLTAIYCQAKSEPMGWDVYWNPNKYKVVWGAVDKFK